MAEKKIASLYTSLEIKDKMSQALKKCDDNLNVLRKTAKETDKEIEKVDSSLVKSAKTFAKWAVGIGASFYALSSIKSGIQSLSRISDEYGQNASRIKNATSSLEEYNLVQQRILENANLTYRSLSEAQEVYIGLSGSLKALGVSSEDVLNITESLSFAFVRDAARADQATSAIDAYSKALQKGKNIAVSSDAWATMMAATPSLADSIASAFNKTTAEILNLGSTGKLSIEAINEGLKKSRDESERIASEMKTSNADAMQALSNSFTVFVGKVEESANMSKPFVNTINEISAFFQDPAVIQGVADFAESIAKAFTSSLKFAQKFFGGLKVLASWVASERYGIAADDIVRIEKQMSVLKERLAREDKFSNLPPGFITKNRKEYNELKNLADMYYEHQQKLRDKADKDIQDKEIKRLTELKKNNKDLPDLTVDDKKKGSKSTITSDLNMLLKSYDKELSAFLKMNDFKRKDNELLYKNYQKNFETYFKEKQAIELSDYKKQQEIFDAQLKDAQDTRNLIKATADNKKEIQTIDNNILEILNKKNALEEEYNFKLKESTFEYQNQIDKIKQMQQAMQSNIANLIGNTKKSETITLDVEVENLRKENANNTEMLAYIDTLEQIKRSKIEQNEATRLLAISEEELNFNRENGSIQYADYNNKFNDIINRRIELLKKERDLVLQIGGEDSQARIKELDQQIKVLEQSSKSFGKEMNIVLRESFAQNLKDVMNGTKSLKDAMIDMLNSIADKISSIVADNLTNSLFGEKGSGKGGLFEGLFSGGGGLFGGILNSLGSLMGFATGGVYNKGDIVKIGEGGGQEAFIASENGRIYNKEQMNRITNNNSNQSNIFNINIKADKPNEFRNSHGQLIAQINQMMYIGKKNQ